MFKNRVELSSSNSANFLFWICVVLGTCARLCLSTLGYNHDLEYWWLASTASINHQSVYSVTANYNYGPIWFVCLGLLRRLIIALNFNDISYFHIAVAGILTLADCCVALILRSKFGVSVALLFLLNPISILISGYHCQFDNLAILFALSGCCLLDEAEGATSGKFLIGMLFLGLSLATKHLLIFFPIWLWWMFRDEIPSKRTLAAVIPYGLFAISFLPFVFESSSLNGIIEHVVKYRGDESESLVANVLTLILSFAGNIEQRALPLPRLIFVLIILLSALYWCSQRSKQLSVTELLMVYLLTLVAFSSAMADQYLAISLVSAAYYHRYLASWIYTAVALVILATSPINLFGTRFADPQILSFYHAQIFLALLLAFITGEYQKRGADRG